jgi:hypothetical protein
MRNRVVGLIVVVVLALALSPAAFSQASTAGQSPKDHQLAKWNGDPGDLTGVWSLAGGGGGGGNQTPHLTSWSNTDPTLTAEGKRIMATHKPSEGPRIEPEPSLENDPELTGNPEGLIRSLGYGVYGHEFIKLPDSMFHVIEWYHQWRRIWTDGRKMLDSNIYGPYWYGYSVGKYTPQGLEVETSLLDGRAWLDAWGTPMSDQMQMQEHWRRVDQDALALTVTFNDPVIFTQTWTSKELRYRPHAGLVLEEAILGPIDEQAFSQNIRLAGADGNHTKVNSANDDLRKPGAR